MISITGKIIILHVIILNCLDPYKFVPCLSNKQAKEPQGVKMKGFFFSNSKMGLMISWSGITFNWMNAHAHTLRYDKDSMYRPL